MANWLWRMVEKKSDGDIKMHLFFPTSCVKRIFMLFYLKVLKLIKNDPDLIRIVFSESGRLLL